MLTVIPMSPSCLPLKIFDSCPLMSCNRHLHLHRGAHHLVCWSGWVEVSGRVFLTAVVALVVMATSFLACLNGAINCWKTVAMSSSYSSLFSCAKYCKMEKSFQLEPGGQLGSLNRIGHSFFLWTWQATISTLMGFVRDWHSVGP